MNTAIQSLRHRARQGALGLLLATGATACASTGEVVIPNDPDEREWVQLFDGQSLQGWTPKFTGFPLGENYRNTFRAEDGLLKVRYDNWTDWKREFGHLFYERPFSHYLLAAEYRFVGDQVAGAGSDMAWAIRNNGLMLHSQPPETLVRDQDFPISIEVQLLGGLGNGRARSTANLCTPGTHVVMNGQLFTPHCTNSSSRTYEGDQWVRVEVLVLGDSVVKHIVEGDTVLQYTRPQIGGGSVNPVDPAVKQDGKLLDSGYISIQAESHPTDFRKIEILDLVGCTDPAAANYKRYFVKSDNSRCRYDRR